MKTCSVAAGFVLAAVAVGLLLAREPGPRHGGRTVSDWFDEYCRHPRGLATEFTEAERALLALGTNVVHYLIVTELPRKDPLFWRAVAAMQGRVPDWLRRRHQEFQSRRQTQHQVAHELLSRIRPSGGFLVDLCRLAPEGTNVLIWIARYCGDEKEKLLPYIVAGLKSTNRVQQSWALNSLSHFGPDTPQALDALLSVDFAHSPNFMRWLRAIQSFRDEAERALPLLKEQFARELNPQMKLSIAQTIGMIEKDPQEALAFLIENLPPPGPFNETNRWRLSVFQRLQEIGPKAKPAVPALLEQLRSTKTPWLRMQILIALHYLEADKELVVRLLWQQTPIPHTPKKILDHSQEILCIDPGNTRAIRMLTRLLSESRSTAILMEALGFLGPQGPAAQTALPALEQLLTDPATKSEVKAAAERTRDAISGTLN